MESKKIMLSSFVFSSILLIGCNSQEDVVQDEGIPDVVHSSFILYQEEEQIDNNSVGSLFFKQENSENVVKIADEVLGEYSIYDNASEDILYIDKNSTLYNYSSSEEPAIKIGENVSDMYFTESGKIVYYVEDDGVFVSDKEKSEKIGSDSRQLEIVNDEIYYTEYDQDFIVYNFETREEKRIGSDVYEFNLLDKNEDFIFTDETGALFYQSSVDEQPIKVSSGSVYVQDSTKIGDEVYYIETGSNVESNLYVSNIVENTRAELVANNILDYQFIKGDIVYLTMDNSLYKLNDENTSIRLATDVIDYQFTNDGLIFLESDNTLYNWNEQENKQTVIGHDVQSYEAFSDGRTFYLTENDDLYEGNIKLATDVSYYKEYHDTLVYAVDNLLFSIVGESEQVISEDLEGFSAVYYQNELVYENKFVLKDITGVWEIDSEDEKLFMEIEENGFITMLHSGEEKQLETVYNGYNELVLFDDMYDDEVRFLLENSKLSMTFFGESYTMSISSRQRAKDYINEQVELEIIEQEKSEELARIEQEKQEEKERIDGEKQEASYIVEEFIYYLPYAVNEGKFNYISEYLDYNSDIYDEQSEFVFELYQASIQESLYDFQIVDVQLTDGYAEVNTYEAFEIYNWETGESKFTEYNAVYTLKKINGYYVITNLKVQ